MDIMVREGPTFGIVAIIDVYISLIWKERYNTHGDFELIVTASRDMRQTFIFGRILTLHGTYEAMIIEHVEDTVSSDGVPVIKVSGRSLTAILLARCTRKVSTAQYPWVITTTPASAAKSVAEGSMMVSTVATDNLQPAYDPYVHYPPLIEYDTTIPLPTDQNVYDVKAEPVYDFVKRVLDEYDLGFRVIFDPFQSYFMFNAHGGTDRTRRTGIENPVVFTYEDGSITGSTLINSTTSHYNVAYVIGKNGAATVYPATTVPQGTLFNRKVLTVDANDIDLPAGAELTAALQRKGREELAKHRLLAGFDAEVLQNAPYTYAYNGDYYIGDLVEVVDMYGFITIMRVSEFIFSSDKEGDKAYPTLILNQTVEVGTWSARNTQEWTEPTETWLNAT